MSKDKPAGQTIADLIDYARSKINKNEITSEKVVAIICSRLVEFTIKKKIGWSAPFGNTWVCLCWPYLLLLSYFVDKKLKNGKVIVDRSSERVTFVILSNEVPANIHGQPDEDGAPEKLVNIELPPSQEDFEEIPIGPVNKLFDCVIKICHRCTNLNFKYFSTLSHCRACEEILQKEKKN